MLGDRCRLTLWTTPGGVSLRSPDHYARGMALNRDAFLEEARIATQNRMAAAENIANALAAREEALAQLAQADADLEAAFRGAEKFGWTKTELRRLRPADMKTRTTTKRTRKNTKTANDQQPAPETPAQ